MLKRFLHFEFRPLRVFLFVMSFVALLFRGLFLEAKVFRPKYRALKYGMTFSEVKSILGEPDNVLTYPSDYAQWQYLDTPPLQFREGYLIHSEEAKSCIGYGDCEWEAKHPDVVSRWNSKPEHRASEEP
jgi:hypothetical protein